MIVGDPCLIWNNGDSCGSIPGPQTLEPDEEKTNDDSDSDSGVCSLDDVEEDAVICILSFLSPAEIWACSCLNRRFNDLCSDDLRVWFAMCERRWGTKTHVRKWGKAKIRYGVLYGILDRWEKLVGFWRGVGHGGIGPLVTFDWGTHCLIASRIVPVRAGSYEVRKMPFLWMGVTPEGKGLSFIDPDWLPDSAIDGLGSNSVGSQSGSIPICGLDVGSERLGDLSGGLGLLDEVGVRRVRNPFESFEDVVAEGLVAVDLSFVGDCHIVVEEREDRSWVRSCQASSIGRSGSYEDLVKRKGKGLEDGRESCYGSLPVEISQYFASKVSLGRGERSVRKQRRKEKEKEKVGHGRRKWEAEHFVKVLNCFPTAARPLQGLWKGISDSMSLEFILVLYDECGGIVCRKVGGYSQNVSRYGSVFWTAESFAGLTFSAKEEELYNSRSHVRPMDAIQTYSKHCTLYEEMEVTRVVCINSNSDLLRQNIGVSATGNREGRLWQYTNGKFGFGFLHSNSIVDFKHIGSSDHLLDVVE